MGDSRVAGRAPVSSGLPTWLRDGHGQAKPKRCGSGGLAHSQQRCWECVDAVWTSLRINTFPMVSYGPRTFPCYVNGPNMTEFPVDHPSRDVWMLSGPETHAKSVRMRRDGWT